jgi:hypothetical protein
MMGGSHPEPLASGAPTSKADMDVDTTKGSDDLALGSIPCEACLFFTEGPALAANLRSCIGKACLLSCPPEVVIMEPEEMPAVGLARQMLPDIAVECCGAEEEKLYRGAFALLASRIVSTDFLDSTKNAIFMPFSDAGIRKQILDEMNSVAPEPREEVERISKQIYENKFQNSLTLAAKEKARIACNILSGFDPYPNQPGGAEFAAAVTLAKEDPEIKTEAGTVATKALEEWTDGAGKSPDIIALVELTMRVRRRFGGKIEDAMEVLYSQCQEVTHLSWALTSFNGIGCPYGSKGLVRAGECDGHCPSIYHKSRDAAYSMALEMWEDGTLDRELGLGGISSSPYVPGMPPFYFGDVTPGVGHDYALGTKDKGLGLNQGNQKNDGGVHASHWNRRDGAGLALADEMYMVPDMEKVRSFTQEAIAGRACTLSDGTEAPAVISFTCERSKVKMIQGQKRNDTLVGGDRYIGLALPPTAVALLHKYQKTLMPPDFCVDASFAPHLSIAVMGPSWTPHYKSPQKLAMAEYFMKNGANVTDYYKAHIDAYQAHRTAWTPAETAWDTYETAAAKMSTPACKFNHKLIETIGFKTAVVSPSICDVDKLSTTVYNGTGAPPPLRALGMDTSVLRFGGGGIRSFGVEGVAFDAIESTMTAETYRRTRMPDAEQSEMVENEKKKMRIWTPTLAEMVAKEDPRLVICSQPVSK